MFLTTLSLFIQIGLRLSDRKMHLEPPRSYLPPPVMRLFFMNAPVSPTQTLLVFCSNSFLILQTPQSTIYLSLMWNAVPSIPDDGPPHLLLNLRSLLLRHVLRPQRTRSRKLLLRTFLEHRRRHRVLNEIASSLYFSFFLNSTIVGRF
jgi:hypothetical protein